MISKRARYALHGVGYLAYRQDDVPVPFADILEYLRDYSQPLSLSPGYISKIFQDLSKVGIVQATVGRNGGYGLLLHPAEVSIAEVVAAVDGWPVEQCCLLSMGNCKNQDSCGVNELVRGAQSAFYEMLASQTAESLAAKMFRARPPLGARPRTPAEPAPPARRQRASRRGAGCSSPARPGGTAKAKAKRPQKEAAPKRAKARSKGSKARPR